MNVRSVMVLILLVAVAVALAVSFASVPEGHLLRDAVSR